MKQLPFLPAEMWIPAETVDQKKWSVVACDQYTSQADYWERVEQFVGDAPSTLRLTLPEIYLGREDTSRRIASIRRKMQEYLDQGLLQQLPEGYVYVERTLMDGSVRQGLMGRIDLEQYDFSKGSTSPVRATEGTVLERIPPRVEVRRDAPLELPHIMLLIDDPERTVIEPLAGGMGRMIYDTDLMENGGHLTGRLLDQEQTRSVAEALERLGEPETFAKHSGIPDAAPLIYAVGDGNHSLATAKTCWEELKKTLTLEECQNHPARYALCELVNLHSGALQFEAIHRVLFDVDTSVLDAWLGQYTAEGESQQTFTYVTAAGSRSLSVTAPTSNLTVGSVEELIGRFLKRYGGSVDYVHGADVAAELGAKANSAAFLLPAMEKKDLFPTVVLDGALPRKTFSMGHAWEKRYYFEARKIR